MPFQVETREGSLVLHDHQIQAIVRHAQRVADLTAATLDATGLFPQRPASFPAGFLLELGAVLQLHLWERQGLRQYLNANLPAFRQAADQLAARARKGPQEFEGPEAAPLSSRVLRAWMEHFAWEAPFLLQADIVVGPVDEDQFAEAMAEFIWNHRHELTAIFVEQPGEDQREIS